MKIHTCIFLFMFSVKVYAYFYFRKYQACNRIRLLIAALDKVSSVGINLLHCFRSCSPSSIVFLSISKCDILLM